MAKDTRYNRPLREAFMKGLRTSAIEESRWVHLELECTKDDLLQGLQGKWKLPYQVDKTWWNLAPGTGEVLIIRGKFTKKLSHEDKPVLNMAFDVTIKCALDIGERHD